MKRSIRTLLVALGIAVGCASIAMAGSSPTVSTGAASKISDTGATLGGSINPQGTNTVYRFEYGLTNEYGTVTKSQSAGSGSKSVAVSTGIGKLIPGTTYHYKLLASNKFGAGQGNDHTFKTTGHAPPVAATGATAAVHQSSATLTGTVNPSGEATTWEFQYGLTTAYASRSNAAVLPASHTTSVVATTITGLEPGVTFHYRLVALHGTTVISTGADASFFTLPDPAPKPSVTASTTPRHATHKPYALTTKGSVKGPASIPSALACFGDTTVTYYVGKRKVGSTTTPLVGNCTYSVTTTFKLKLAGKRHKHKKSESVRIVAHFKGNGYYAPAFSKSQTVKIG
jgi:hypothetical protein